MHYDWKELYGQVKSCDKCRLSSTRTNAVFGVGDQKSPLMLIGEGPGRDEDMQGEPFVGQAGKLLDRMLAAIHIRRERVYIANVVKCRPPRNRTPLEDEATLCLPYLRGQTALVSPKIIVLLGATAVRYVLGEDVRITRDRGTWFERKGIWILPTYHPAALLYDESKKRDAWTDMKALRDKLTELGIDIFEEE